MFPRRNMIKRSEYLKYPRSSKSRRRKVWEEKGIVGKCSSCGKLADGFGFKCVCKEVECITCWFKRTGGHENAKTPFWECPNEKCKMVSIYDQDMTFIKRWSTEQWERWKKLGKEIEV